MYLPENSVWSLLIVGFVFFLIWLEDRKKKNERARIKEFREEEKTMLVTHLYSEIQRLQEENEKIRAMAKIHESSQINESVSSESPDTAVARKGIQSSSEKPTSLNAQVLKKIPNKTKNSTDASLPAKPNFQPGSLYRALVDMLGLKSADRALAKLCLNSKVSETKELKRVPKGSPNAPMAALQWLSVALEQADAGKNPFLHAMSSDEHARSVENTEALIQNSVPDHFVYDLIEDLLSHMKKGERFKSGPRDSYALFLDY